MLPHEQKQKKLQQSLLVCRTFHDCIKNDALLSLKLRPTFDPPHCHPSIIFASDPDVLLKLTPSTLPPPSLPLFNDNEPLTSVSLPPRAEQGYNPPQQNVGEHGSFPKWNGFTAFVVERPPHAVTHFKVHSLPGSPISLSLLSILSLTLSLSLSLRNMQGRTFTK